MNGVKNEIEQNTLNRYKTWSIALGVGMIILGLLTIAVAGFTTLISAIFLGLVLSIRGIVEVVHAVESRHEKGFWWSLFSGTLSLVIGALLISRPVIGVLSLTFLISVFLITSGLFRTIAAPIEHNGQWGWVMFGGVCSLILGFIVLSGWPVTAVWFIGLMVGIEILLQGIMLVSMPFTIRHAKAITREVPVH